jgi:hypothetical protein
MITAVAASSQKPNEFGPNTIGRFSLREVTDPVDDDALVAAFEETLASGGRFGRVNGIGAAMDDQCLDVENRCSGERRLIGVIRRISRGMAPAVTV